MSDVPLALSGCVSLQQIADILRYYQEDIDELRASGVEITFYELMTVVAVFYFAQQDVDIVVLETGLGGRFDATNIFETSVCGITPIGFDHMNVLGNTLTAIAGEKAGIIRSPLQRVVLAPQAVEAMAVLKARCDGFGIRPEVVGVDIPLAVHAVTADGVSFDVEGRRKYTGLISPLTGRHQAENAALAIGMAEDLETFGFVITEKAVQEGVASVQWPARFEKVGVSPIVILDCAHTQESAQALADTFMASYPGEKAIIVVGMSSDKDADGFLEALKPIAQALVFTKADNPRAMDFLNSIEPVSQALIEARRLAGKDGIILVTGSVFICAEARG